MDVVVAGGGIAGLEGLLALHDMAGDHVSLRLISPDRDFSYRPLAVAEPFGLGHAYHVPLKQVADDVGAELIVDAVVGADDASRQVRLRDGGALGYDALLLATGGRPVAGMDGATTWWPEGDPDVYGGLLRDIEEGYTKRLAIVVPLGAVWPLPVYELALMTAGEAREMGHDDVQVTIVTPEQAPLSLFGEEASEAVAEELRWAGVDLKTGVVARKAPGGLVLDPGAEQLDAQRVFAVPRLEGPGTEGVPTDEEGFIRADDDGLIEGCERTWAAGDGVVSPLKFGGLATHQARRAAAAIARLAGAGDVPDPGEAVVHGQLLVGHRRRRLRSGDDEGAPLWFPKGKVAGEYLPRWLVEHGIAPPPSEETPPGGVTVNRSLRALRGAEAQHLFDLSRRLDSRDPAVAALGRRMRELRDR
ncbi:MAG TPA: FAD-dependent oxidoreductase [Solirubrobacteraceae bacterium]|nr:FAD-dependent oxidoreductase [Solirubrobacteraceae bacterium]